MQSQYIFSDRPALGWTVEACSIPTPGGRMKFAHKISAFHSQIRSALHDYHGKGEGE
nr:hypothetical protein [uncultured Prevotella sp.]